MSRKPQAATEGALAALGIVVYVLFSASFYAAAGHDDSFITLWAGRSLGGGRGLIDHHGTPVEISSSLLHVFIVAGLTRIAPGLVFLGNKLVGLCSGLALLAVLFGFRDSLLGPPGRGRPFALGFALLSLATCPFWLYWNLGGLETPLQSLLLFLLACALAADRGRPGDSFLIVSVQTLYLLARPEGFIATVAVALHLLALPRRSRVSLRRATALVGLPVVAGVSLGIWRLLTFGAPFPNPVYAKVGIHAPVARLRAGLDYVAGCLTSGPYFLILGGAVLLVLVLVVRDSFRADGWPWPRAASRSLLIPALAQTAFVLLVGGDWMGFYRFLVPALPLYIVAVAARIVRPAAEGLVAAGPGARLLRQVGVAAVLLLVTTNVGGRAWPGRCSTQAGIGDLLGIRSAEELQEKLISLNCAYGRDERDLLPYLHASLRDTARRHGGRIVVATVQMGFFPWIVRTEFPGLDVSFVDTFGITDPHVARLDVPKVARGVAPGISLGAVVDGGAGELTRFVREKGANLAYAVDIPVEDRRRFVHAGWRLVWDRPGAVVFEAGEDSGQRAEGRTVTAGGRNDGIETEMFP